MRDPDASKADCECPTSLASAKDGSSLDCDAFSALHKEVETKRHHAMMLILFRIKVPVLLIVD